MAASIKLRYYTELPPGRSPAATPVEEVIRGVGRVEWPPGWLALVDVNNNVLRVVNHDCVVEVIQTLIES